MVRSTLSPRRIAGIATLSVAVLAFGYLIASTFSSRLPGLDPTNPRVTLADIEQVVAAKFPVPEITAPELTAALADPGTVVFDVREADEHAQSHIPGARRVSPGLSGDAFLKTYGAEIVGKRVVVYCSVGVRSGILAQRIAAANNEASTVVNLRGGIFRWHATGGRLAAPQSTAPVEVHPYDANWGQLLSRTLDKS